MQNRNLLPFFWPKLVAPAVFIGALASGCAAGGGTAEGRPGEAQGAQDSSTPRPPSTATTPTLNNPAPAAPAANTDPSANAPVNTTPATNAPASNAGNEALPSPERDDDALPPEDPDADDSGGNTPPANPGANDDDDDDDDDNGGDDNDDDSDDDDGDDDDGDDDDDDDNGGDDDDNGGDDDDGGGTGVTPPPTPGNPPPADAITFTADIRPILVANCGRCHASGGLPQFASANAATGYDVAFRERNSIVSEIRSGSMPEDTCNGSPGSNGCVSVANFNLIQQWVAAGAPE